MCTFFTLENISYLFSIVIPIILLCWFYISQKNAFNNEILGIYAGWAETPEQPEFRINAGGIMNIKDVVSSGYFRGNLDWKVVKSTQETDKLQSQGIFDFFGYITYTPKLWRIKKRNPLKPKDNRIYEGKLFLVDRLDISFKIHDIEKMIYTTYEIKFYRDYKALSFKLISNTKKRDIPFPNEMFLDRDNKFVFGTYQSLKEGLFGKNSFSDRQ